MLKTFGFRGANMNYYIELTLINDKELGFSKLWSVVYTQLHLAFVEMQDTNAQIPIGVSFPEYKVGESKGKAFMLLGSKLRIFAQDEATLTKLNLPKWLARLEDYVHIKSIKPVPENVQNHLVVSRYRPKANIELVARRIVKRKQITLDLAIAYLNTVDEAKKLKGYVQKWEPFPYIQLKSLSGKQEFSLCIRQVAADVIKGCSASTILSGSTTIILSS